MAKSSFSSKPAARPIAIKDKPAEKPTRSMGRRQPAEVAETVEEEPLPETTATRRGIRSKPAEVIEPEVIDMNEATDDGAQLPAAYRAPVAWGQVAGEKSASDVERPLIKLINDKSPLIEEFGCAPGEIVLKNEILLWQPGQKENVKVTVLKAEKLFIEKTAYGSEEMGAIFATRQEAADAGLEVTWNRKDKKGKNLPPDVAELVYVTLLVEAPKGIDEPEFSLKNGKTAYTIASLRVTGTSVKPIFTKINTDCKAVKATYYVEFELLASKVKRGPYTYWIPVLKRSKFHDEKFVGVLEDWLNQIG